MVWRYLVFVVSIIITILSFFLYIFFDFPFLFFLLLLPPFYLFNRDKKSQINYPPQLKCKNCGKEIYKKNYKFCPYCGQEQFRNDKEDF
ncbi:MAG: zinc-ribbon domain-containing protein [Candidatus Helarchaeota archaeon]|nr:zinc-ribbon domain-containing protein [Candidatus Helarchaeota archaeon]